MTAEPEIGVPPLVFLSRTEHPSDAYHRAWELLQDRAPLEALTILEPAVEAEPEATSLRTLRAWAYFMRVQLQKAEADLRLLVDHDPSDVWARHALGRTLERQSRPVDALPHLKLASAMSGDPEHDTAVLRVERQLAEAGTISYDDLS